MFNYGKSDYEKFSNIIEEAYQRYDDIKSTHDLKGCFPKFRIEDRFLEIEKKATIIELSDDEGLFEMRAIVSFFSYQMYRILFYILFIEVEDNEPFIVFFIPHSHFASWVKGEFREEVGEFSGRRGNLSSSANRNVAATLMETQSTNQLIVVLHRFETQFDFLNELISNYFEGAPLEGTKTV